MKKQKAFSLIELSIVILIIGILIAGVTQSSRLVRESKIKTAQNLTQGSLIRSTKGLLLWFEPVMDDSFLSTQTEDQTQLTQWNDLNPQVIANQRYYAIKNATSHAIYTANGINNLPTVKFSGVTGSTDAYFSITPVNTAVTANTYIRTTDNTYTYFIVASIDPSILSSDTVGRTVFIDGTGCCTGFAYLRDNGNIPFGQRAILHGGNNLAFSTTAMGLAPEVVSVTYTGTGVNDTATFSMYVNGVTQTLHDTNSFWMGDYNNTTTNVLQLGGSGTNDPWKGFISEFVLFEGVLSTGDRQEIEKSRKKIWN